MNEEKINNLEKQIDVVIYMNDNTRYKITTNKLTLKDNKTLEFFNIIDESYCVFNLDAIAFYTIKEVKK